SGEVAFWGFRIRFDPATTFGDSYCNMLAHTSFGAVQSGPTFWGKNNNTSQNFQLTYNRGSVQQLIAKPTTYWLDVKAEYKTAPGTSGYITVWLKRHDEAAFPTTATFAVTGIDSYGLSTDINQVTWGIYEYTSLGKGDWPCNALQKFAVATTAAEIDSFLAPPAVVAPAPPPPHIDAAAGDGKVTITRGIITGARSGDLWQLYRSTSADFSAPVDVNLSI